MFKVKSRLREDGVVYQEGDEYKGKRHDELLSAGILFEVKQEEEKPKKKVKKTRKKSSKKTSKASKDS